MDTDKLDLKSPDFFSGELLVINDQSKRKAQ